MRRSLSLYIGAALNVAVLLSSVRAAAHGDMNGAAVGPDKAVLEADHDKGFRLSAKALANIGLKSVPARGDGTNWIVPRSALVQFQDHTALYRLRDGWFLKLDVNASVKGSEAVVKTAGLRAGDAVASEGVGLLRATDLDVGGGEDDDDHDHDEGHDHGAGHEHEPSPENAAEHRH